MTILVLSSSSSDRAAIIETVVAAGHEAALAETSAQALARISRGSIDLVLVDLGVGADALRFLRKFTVQRGSLPVVCVADRRQPDAAAEALRLGIVDVVGRPVRADDVLAALANARELARIAQRAAAPTGEAIDAVDGLFGASPAMRDVLGIVRRVAHSRCGVLIVGERGTGREMIARAIHAQGPRRDAPFIKIARGERTNADLGTVLDGAAAPESTVYLENVAELSLEGQGRLVQRVTAPGASESFFRIIAAAEPRITDWMERGVVRRDLLDAIGTVRIDLPALRQRGQDVPLLATHFLKEACRRNDLPAKTFSRSALVLLAALPWPGNASELRSFAERLALLVPRGVVLLEDVLANVRLDGIEAMGRPRDTLRDARERFERDYITSMLRHHRGRMGPAARELGIERTNLYRKIRQLKVRLSFD